MTLLDMILNVLPQDDVLLADFIEARQTGKDPCEIVADGLGNQTFLAIIRKYPKTIEYLTQNMGWLQDDLPRTVRYLEQVAKC